MVFTDCGISIFVSAVHFVKADSPIEMRGDRIEIFESEVHSLNAQIPIDLTDEGIDI